jgi:hypothetical protein
MHFFQCHGSLSFKTSDHDGQAAKSLISLYYQA